MQLSTKHILDMDCSDQQRLKRWMQSAMPTGTQLALTLFNLVINLTNPIDIVANAKGSPMILAMLALLRLGEFILYGLMGFFNDGEYSDLWPSMECREASCCDQPIFYIEMLTSDDLWKTYRWWARLFAHHAGLDSKMSAGLIMREIRESLSSVS